MTNNEFVLIDDGEQKPDKTETKNERFVRLANSRTNNALESLRLIGNLANTRNYEYTESQVKQIFDALDESIKLQKALFKQGKKHSDFNLRSTR